jgi:glutamate N-acetyltransferase/amino-acid N-acetyltransferase
MSIWNIEALQNCGGLADVPGFRVSGVGCDIRGKGDPRLDLGIVHSKVPCAAAGVFTTNRVRAAPVMLCEERLAKGGVIHGVVANSGNANACTGPEGAANALEMTALAEQCSGAPEGSFLVAQTGRIGRQVPMDSVRKGIRDAASALAENPKGGIAFADAILTSDTRNKKRSLVIRNGSQQVHLAAVAKGAGMIRPDMATMLAFIATDLQIERSELRLLLKEAADVSFNAITVDGDMSTNDTVIALANGVSAVSWADADEAFRSAFRSALRSICEDLALLIVGDGEKISKVVTLEVEGADSREDARKAGYAVAHSALVKASWAGSDPNWGRVLAAVGYSGVAVDQDQLCMWYDAVPVVEQGRPVDANLPQWRAIVARKSFSIRLNLAMGPVSTRLIASDLTPEYITFNMKE